MLTFEESWASGRIDLMYPKTHWRPTRAYWGEWAKDRRDLDSILVHLGEDYEYWMRRDAAEYLLNTFIPMDFPDKRLSYWKFQFPIDIPERVHFYDWCGSRHAGMIQDRNADIVPSSWHLEDGLCRFGSTFHIMLQQAVIEGYKEIYCIGLDLGYSHERVNYFDPDYQIKEWSEKLADHTTRTHVLAHEIARHSTALQGVTIYNATRGGNLEVYPRVKFDSLF